MNGIQYLNVRTLDVFSNAERNLPAFNGIEEVVQIIVRKHLDRGWVHGVVNRYDLQNQSGIFHRLCQRSHMIEIPGERKYPAQTDASKRRLKPDDPTQGGRNADGPASIRAQ